MRSPFFKVCLAGPMDEYIVPIGIQRALNGNGMSIPRKDFRNMPIRTVPTRRIWPPGAAGIRKIKTDPDLSGLQEFGLNLRDDLIRIGKRSRRIHQLTDFRFSA